VADLWLTCKSKAALLNRTALFYTFILTCPDSSSGGVHFPKERENNKVSNFILQIADNQFIAK
jgi:hypothetical protein